MPHSSRRPRKPYHPKRIISESEDGWSRVEHTAPPRYGRTAAVDSSLPPVDRSLTAQKLLDEHNRCKQQWVESDARRWLQQLLARQMTEGGWSLNKAICVALGSPSLSWANRHRSVWQLVMFMDLVDLVRPKLNHANEFKLYAQEPRFTSLDREFLQSLDIAVLDPPQAEELVDQSTLIFIPCIEWLLELPFMLVAKTSPLYVSSSMHWIIDEAERSRNRLVADVNNKPPVLKECDDAIAAAKAVLDTHDENKMPEADFADGHSLALTIYTLKHQDED
ncbi:unnamed protein product [Aureobasidium uvarum]|uniref:SRR1-like domain-containing protein n=1 Tax=Aureobasidium uvarum TaxID=2773716 RepID=A0A9N8PTQ4_9PEZI|nr:unnamed protein product [Aureobasidium uvarum]